MNEDGNSQAFILAVIAFVGFFVYAITLTVRNTAPDPVIFPVVGMIVTLAGTFFFGSHIANGAAGKALDQLVATGKEREAAIAAARGAATTPPPPPPPAAPVP